MEPQQTLHFRDGARLDLYLDDTGADCCPRDGDNLGLMICVHPEHHDLGDPHPYNSNRFSGWDALEAAIRRDHNPTVLLPLYLYDHSGLALSTGCEYPFNCPWDSMLVGFLLAPAINVARDFPPDTPNLEAAVRVVLEAELATYNQWLSGDVWGFIFTTPKPACPTCGHAEPETDSCWGFFGSHPLKNGMVEHIPPEYRDELSLLLESHP